MELHFEQHGKSGPPLVILHGLFGSAANWRAQAKRFADRYRTYSLDQRNHGKSRHAPSNSYADMADDTLEFLDRIGAESALILGHSMGGKVAMSVALQAPARVRALVVVDISPCKGESGGLRSVLAAMRAVDPESADSRSTIEKALAARGVDSRTRAFLMMNIERHDDGLFSWRLNLEAIEASFDVLTGPIRSGRSYGGPTLFIRGGHSNHVGDEDLPSIREMFPAVEVVTLAEAGHWVHADSPNGFFAAVNGFLSRAVGMA